MITKEELSKVLKSTGIPVNENISSIENRNQQPRIVYWEQVWEEVHASDDSYQTVVNYQVSLFDNKPRKNALKLKRALNEAGQRPVFYHEYIEEDNEFHTTCSIDVLEDLG